MIMENQIHAPNGWLQARRDFSKVRFNSKPPHITKLCRDTRPRSGVGCKQGWAATD
jgi:hypothetical protein